MTPTPGRDPSSPMMSRRARLAWRAPSSAMSRATPRAAGNGRNPPPVNAHLPPANKAPPPATNTPPTKTPVRAARQLGPVDAPAYTRDPMSVVHEHSVRRDLQLEYNKRLMLVAGRAHPALAARIADKLGVALGRMTLRTFSDGEIYCRYEESVRGADVFIVQPTCANPVAGLSPNDSLMELLAMVDAAVGGSADRVIAVAPRYRD